VLDPNVSQEMLKLTIAYKAETNVVDIVPQAKRLRLSLNMPFAELDDPRRIARNVAGVGRWGHGEVELGVASLKEVPYESAEKPARCPIQPSSGGKSPVRAWLCAMAGWSGGSSRGFSANSYAIGLIRQSLERQLEAES
jgi:predicted transport protein